MMLPHNLCRKQKLYRWVYNHNIESAGKRVSNGGGGGLGNWGATTVVGEGGGEGWISESRLVHILHDGIKISVNLKILELFVNVIFVSNNFIVTSNTSPSWFPIRNPFRQSQVTNPGIIAPGAYWNFCWKEGRLLEGGCLLKFLLKGGALIGRRVLNRGKKKGCL